MGQTYLVEELRLRDFSHRNCEAQCPWGGGDYEYRTYLGL